MIFMKRIDWLDIDTGEAFVLLSDGVIDLYCFADHLPSERKDGDAFSGEIFEFEAGFAKSQFDNQKKSHAELIQKTDHAYNLFGVIDNDWNLRVGEFVIDMPDEMFEDYQIGEYVVVDVPRLDMEF
ncbi:hypothetical protein [Lactiplantibacillus herbarum]|uniref:hypothetical protein n=1 Tax=Lactiplantibacillus herbarum TaxID=1670446 RepID=UPI00064E844A|nr:hypothetical protein [Lactiplantibacillus herbarum]